MPLTNIEASAFQGTMQHVVTAFSIDSGTVVVVIAPWQSDTALSTPQVFCFYSAHLVSRDVMDDGIGGHKPSLPWDIIGFDSHDLGHDRWRFVLHCDKLVRSMGWSSAAPAL